MEFLITSYDHALIYYPNLFFPIFFLFCCITIIFIIKATILLNSYLILLLGEISNAVKKIRIKKNLKLTKIQTRKTLSRKYLVVFSSYAFTYLHIFVKTTNNTIRLFSIKTNRIIEKIKKEVLING